MADNDDAVSCVDCGKKLQSTSWLKVREDLIPDPGFMCTPCAGRRLGRPLSPSDFTDPEQVHGMLDRAVARKVFGGERR